MIRICALNDYDSPGSDGPSDKTSATKEALEAEAYSIYNSALSLQIEGDVDQAEEMFEELLDHDFLQEATKLVEEEECDNPGQPGLQLLYSTYKNLASMAYKKEDIHRAIQFYLKAVMIDETEVTVWYKIGTIALEIHNYQLASYAFQQGLKCNKNHWPCLDHVITALYVLNDYWTCLKFIAKALQKDAEYMKAIAFRDQIFSEQPSLEVDSAPFFKACEPEVLSLHADKEEKDEYINEALEMRKIRREISYVPPPPPHSLPKPISEFTWKCVGECLLVLYDELAHSVPRKSMGLRVDLTPYVASDSEEEEEEQIEEPDVQMTESEQPCPPSSQEGSAKVESMDVSKGGDQTNTEAGDTPGNSGTSSPSVQMLSSPNPANNNENGLIEMEDSSVRKQGQKRRRNVPIEETGCKRRSARVRNTTRRKQEENVDIEELLLKFLPSSLLEVREDEEEGKNGDQNSEQEAGSSTGCSNETSDVVQLITATEEIDVEKFLKDSVENGGIIDLMGSYLIHLSELAHLKWSDGLVEVYLKVYNSVRKHLKLPSFLCSEEPAEYIVEMGKMVLASAELKLDHWLTKKARLKTSPANSRNRGSCSITLNQLEPNFPGLFYTEDLWYISGLIGFSDIMAAYWAEHAVRVFWLKARFSMLQGQLEESIEYFDRALEYLQYGQETDGLSIVQLPNCKMDDAISLENIKLQQDSLRRYQSLEETQKLYDSEEYEKVVDLLLLTFTIPTAKGKMNVPRTTSAGLLEMGVAIPERHSQLLLLMDSLLKLKDYKRYVVWGEVSFNECLLNYRKSISHTVKDEWVAAMIQLFDGLDKAILTDPTSIKELTSACTLRLAKNLIKVIVDSLDVPEYATEMPISSVLPWKLLYHIIKNEERKLEMIQVLDESNKEILENSMSSSLMLLNVAHDYLGRHAWCTKSDGQLLLFFMSVLKTERARYPEDKPHAFKDELDQAFEQCVFCLYGYPTKKAKTRYLQDHNALQIDLDWESSQCLFEYFKPKTVPEFDSYKTSTVSGDLENLARRITLLVPKEKNPANSYESVLAYIEGHHNEPPSIPVDKPITMPIVKELYYLLADYYFKNKEQTKAIKFYILDICVNPDRLDSWAGMSLARMSRLEQKLNSTELRMDQPIYKQAIASLRCFTRAVEIDSNNAKLWIEYGSLAYQLHSHASRQLKLMDWFPLSDELFQIATASKKEMLLIAANCYKKANECETEGGHNEEWLHFYMMGKVCEKMRTPPCEYLEHYREAAEHLHEDYAAYPKKINYVVSPPHLAVESLELYYRQHVAILKELLYKKTEDLDLDYFEHYLREVAEGPFAHFREKKRQRKECKDSSWTGTEEIVYSNQPSTVIATPITPTIVNITTTAAVQITATTATAVTTTPAATVVATTTTTATTTTPNPTSTPITTNTTAPTTSTSSATVSMTTTSTSFSYVRSNQDHNYFRQKSSDSSSHSALSEKPDDHAPQSDKTKTEDSSSKKNIPLPDMVGDSESGYKSTVSSDALRVTPPSKEVEAPPRLGRIDLSQPVFGLDDQFTTTVNQDYLNSTIDANAITSQALDSLNALLESETFRTDNSDIFALDPDFTGHSSEEQQSRGSSDIASHIGVSDSNCSSKVVSSAIPVTNNVPISNNPVNSSNSVPDNTIQSQPKAFPKSVSSEDEPSEISNEAVMDSVSSLSGSNSNPGPIPPVNPKSRVQRHKELLDVVIGALHLCLSRFPTHYKALYRLAHLHYYHPFHKNMVYSRDILLGVTSSWTKYPHLPAPGLFTDRKHSNFFQGVWRIPIEEVDRPGSFASHMNRTIKLLMEVLRKQCDNQVLFQLHIQLSRTPEPGRKYLRDAERVCFSHLSYEYALDTIELQMEEVSEADRERQIKFLMEVYKVWYHGVNKVYLHVERTNDIFLDIFRVIMKNTIPIKTTTVEQLEQAIRFCQQQLSIGKPSQVTYQSSIPVMTDYQRQQQQQQQHHHHHQQQHYHLHHQMSGQSSSSLGTGTGHTGPVSHGGLIAMSSSGAKMSSLEPIDLTGGVNPELMSMSHSNTYHSMLGMDGLEGDVDMAPVDPRKLIKPCTVKLAAIPRSLMHSNSLTIKPSPSTEDIKQRLKTALLNQSRHQMGDNRLLKSTSEPCSPSTLTPDISATHSH